MNVLIMNTELFSEQLAVSSEQFLISSVDWKKEFRFTEILGFIVMNSAFDSFGS